MVNKSCKKCSSKEIKKDWRMRWKQRYKCKNCGYVFQNQSRNKNNWKLLKEYVNWKQTYQELSEKYWITKQTIQKRLDKIEYKKNNRATRNYCFNWYNILLKKVWDYGL